MNQRVVTHYVISGLILAASALAAALTPKTESTGTLAVNLEQVLPEQFGNWKSVPSAYALTGLTAFRDNDAKARIYDQTVMRSYKGSRGELVMLAVAWGQRQSQEVKVHRPELCYTAQGFQVLSQQSGVLRVNERSIPVTHLVTRNPQRFEPITYWIRLGDSFSSGPWETRFKLLKQGLRGNVPDGILVRVSTIARAEPNVTTEFKTQEIFLRELLDAMDTTGRQLMVGRDPVEKYAWFSEPR